MRAIILSVFLAFCAAASAQDNFPSKSIRLITPFNPGGAIDVLTRVIAEKLQARLGQPVVVEAIPGANTIIGTQAMLKGAPDGHTFMITTMSTTVNNPVLYAKLPYEAKDLAPITQLSYGSVLLVGPANASYNDVKGLIAWAKAQNRPINFGSVGAGSSQHLAGSQFQVITGLPMQHLPYTNSGQMNTDLIEGRTDMLFQSISAVTQMVQTGRMNAIAVSGTERVPAFPDLPTMREQGVDITSTGWFGLCTPAGVPDSILARLEAELGEILQEPELRQRIAALGALPRRMGRQDFARFMAEESQRWRVVIQAVGATAE
jgi:tripartite-type tricarboxylate transporter receptor subunit TctC